MPSLQVRDLPEAIYQKLIELAQKEHRSIAQQAVILLAKGLEISLTTKERRKTLFDKISNDTDIENLTYLSDPTDLIRKDRER